MHIRGCDILSKCAHSRTCKKCQEEGWTCDMGDHFEIWNGDIDDNKKACDSIYTYPNKYPEHDICIHNADMNYDVVKREKHYKSCSVCNEEKDQRKLNYNKTDVSGMKNFETSFPKI